LLEEQPAAADFLEGNMTNPIVPILPGRGVYRSDAVDQAELKRLFRIPKKRDLSLDRTQLRILVEIVLPYWQNYLKSIAHPIDTAGIFTFRFAWAKDVPEERRRIVGITRSAVVAMEVWTSIDLFPERVVIKIDLCRRNVPHECLIVHDGRGRFEISLADPECDGTPH
jgi:hypothetical protein